MKCSYCPKDVLYCMNVILDNKTIELAACDEHKYQAALEQNKIIRQEEYNQRLKLKLKLIQNEPHTTHNR